MSEKIVSMSIKNLKIGELTLTNGKLSTEKPQKISWDITNNSVKLYGIEGDLTYDKNIIIFKGTCNKIEANNIFG
jgi:hypothetical protein